MQARKLTSSKCESLVIHFHMVFLPVRITCFSRVIGDTFGTQSDHDVVPCAPVLRPRGSGEAAHSTRCCEIVRPNVNRESGIYYGGEVNLRKEVNKLLGGGNISISKEEIKAAVLKEAERVASRAWSLVPVSAQHYCFLIVYRCTRTHPPHPPPWAYIRSRFSSTVGRCVTEISPGTTRRRSH